VLPSLFSPWNLYQVGVYEPGSYHARFSPLLFLITIEVDALESC